MNEFFKSKSGKVIIVEPSSSVRTLIADTVRSLGFNDVESMATVKDVLQALEVEDIYWILTPVMPDGEVNSFQLLKICSQYSRLNKTRITLMVDESEELCLLPAFELGLMSYLKKPFNKDDLKQSLQSLIHGLESCDWEDTLVASNQLRELLSKQGRHKTRLAFEKKLLNIFPGKPSLLLNLVEPLAHCEDKHQARAVLEQVRLLEPGLGERIKAVEAKAELDPIGQSNAPTPTNGSEQGEPAEGESEAQEEEAASADTSSSQTRYNSLGVDSCWIIDPNEEDNSEIKQICEELGVPEVRTFEDGTVCAEEIDGDNPPGLIIMEWAIPGLTGPLLIQRFRDEGLVSTPIIIISENIENDELPLIREMGASNFIKKPFSRQELLEPLIWTIQEERTPKATQTLERNIRTAIAAKKLDEAKTLAQQIFDQESSTEELKNRITAEIAYAEQDYKKAKYFAIEAIKLSGESLFILNLLGKTLIKLGELDDALQCFEKAQMISPLNLRRLCSMAEVNVQLGNNEEAQELTEAARGLDEGAEVVQKTTANVAVATGDKDTALKYMGALEPFKDIIAFLNNKAVSLARSGKIDESLQLYINALDILPEDQVDQAVIYYNKALAHIRGDQYPEAVGSLEKAKTTEKESLRKKCINLQAKVQNAIDKNRKLNIVSSSEDKAAQQQSDSQEEASQPIENIEYKLASFTDLEVSAGKNCCGNIYVDEENRSNTMVKKMLGSMPRFKFRETIVKDEVPAA